MLCSAMLCDAILCNAMLYYAMICCAMLCWDRLGCAMLCYAAPCYAMGGGNDIINAIAEVFADLLNDVSWAPDSWRTSEIVVLFERDDPPK
eukprot:7779806-Pyramimonas_sp.AAC.1